MVQLKLDGFSRHFRNNHGLLKRVFLLNPRWCLFLVKESETIEGLSKTEFTEFLSVATKDSHFIFDRILFFIN